MASPAGLGAQFAGDRRFGAHTVAQLEDNLGAVDLDEGHLASLHESSAISTGYPYDFIADIDGAR